VRSALLLSGLVLAACSGPTITGTACASDADCNLFDVRGSCEATGYCSYPDAACSEGRRYAPAAGDGLANACLGEGAGCGARDRACCEGNVCAANLSCAIETGTCQCGGADQPCCGGVACDDGLACGAGAICQGAGVLDVAVGMGTVCALRVDRTVWCWGADHKPYPVGTPGRGHAVLRSPVPIQIEGLADVEQIRGAETHTCARKQDKTLWCWGHNESGQLGNGTFTHSVRAVQVQGLSNVGLFEGGRNHTCAVGTVGGAQGLWCWGRGGTSGHQEGSTPTAGLGKLGNNNVVDQPTPVAVDLSVAAASGQTVRSLATGSYHSCIVMSDDTVWCWGRNDNGLGLGTGSASGPTMAPTQVSLAGLSPARPTGVTITEVSVSDGRQTRTQPSSCLRLSSGVVHCWGYGVNGENGDSTTASRMAPTTAVATGVRFTALASPANAHCGIDEDGAVWCWGRDKSGVLGLGLATEVAQPSPRRVQELEAVTRLDASHHTACAIDGASRLWCWGNNRRGQVKARRPVGFADAIVITPHEVGL
jgi:alpha-tubulin suppressor-like RCC1 family protein